MEQETLKLQQYQVDDKLLFGYSDGTNVFVTFNEFIKKFAQSIPPATLQRKKRAVIQSCEERHCPAKYLRLFKAVNVVGESARKISVITLTQAQSLIELLAGRRLKYVQSPAVTEKVESTTMETEDARMLPNCVSMENLAQSPLDGSSSDGTSTLASTMQSEFNTTENSDLLPPVAESRGEVTLTGPANETSTHSTENPNLPPPVAESRGEVTLTGPVNETSTHSTENSNLLLPVAESRGEVTLTGPANETSTHSTENPNLPPPVAESRGEVTLTGSAIDNKETSASGKKKKMSLKVNLKLHEALAKDLAHMKTFYTRDYYHKRLGMKLSETTVDKSIERIQGTAKLLVPRTCHLYTRAHAYILGHAPETTVIAISLNVVLPFAYCLSFLGLH